jgi:DUF1680 family protein
MKNIIFTLIISLIATSYAVSQPKLESLNLPEEWNFLFGDNPEYSMPEYNDQAWEKIIPNNYWKKNGRIDFSGVAWYRTRVVIPSSLKNNDALVKAVQISLGKINRQDTTYFNGEEIGSTSNRHTERSYLIPFELIRWDQENVIAIKVNGTGGYNGMYGGTLAVRALQLSDLLELSVPGEPVKFVTPNAKFSNALNFNLKTPVDIIKGTLAIKVYNVKNNEVIFQKDDQLTVGNKADSVYNLSFDIKEPANYKVEYSFSCENLSGSIAAGRMLSYISTPRMNEHAESPVVKELIPGKAMPFDLEAMKFGGYLNGWLNVNLHERLLNIDETGILECYYNRPTVQPWGGEYTGKYLHAASRVWRSSKDPQLKEQMDRIVDILIACQTEEGYLGAYLAEDYWTSWDVWSHKYNMLGLLSYYSVTGYKPALDACVKMGDLLCRTYGEDPGQRRIIDKSHHVGMASTSVLEPMTYLYRVTGDKKYLDFCNYIIESYDLKGGPEIISTLTTIGKVDKTANGKAYEMMSNLTGIVKLYQLTGNEELLLAVENAWDDITAHKLYITGTTSAAEHFKADFVLPADDDAHMGEGCVTTTWVQFSQALYYLTGDPKYVGEMEKSIYNHVFAAEDPQTGGVSYYTALQDKKPYRSTIEGHCCLASIPRAISAVPELAYAKNADNGFSINLYSTGKLVSEILDTRGEAVGVQCSIQSSFPAGGQSTISITPEKSSDFKLSLYVPDWCANFKAVINGNTMRGKPGHYLDIEQRWEGNTVIKASFDMTIQELDGGLSYPDHMALKYGAQVLSVDQTLNPEIRDLDKLSFGSPELTPLPKTSLPSGWIGGQVFKANAYYEDKPVDINLVPYADASQTGGDIRTWIPKK